MNSSGIYSNNQADFIARSQMVIGKCCEDIQAARESGQDLGTLFFSILDIMAKERQQIALDHGTEDAPYFGRSRLHSTSDVNVTGLGQRGDVGARYKPYNDTMMANIQQILSGAIPLRGDPETKQFQIKDQFEGRRSSFEIELLTPKELRERQWDREVHSELLSTFAKLQLRRNPAYQRIDAENFLSSSQDLQLAEEFHTDQKKLKKHRPDIYVQKKMNYVLEALVKTFPSPKKIFHSDGTFDHLDGDPAYLKNIFVLCKVRIEIDGKMYALSEYITWTYQNFAQDPVDRLSGSSITIIHQDRYLIEATLKEVSMIFKRCLEWDCTSGDVKDLIKQVGLIRYLFAHTMPYMRGSAAISESLEEVIYRDRGFVFSRIENKSADLEAFVAPMWPTFIQELYQETFRIERVV